MDIHLESEARLTKPKTIVIAECDGLIETSLPHRPFHCICGDKYASMVWLSSHIAKEGIGHRRQIVED
jgi:hypothetical protein